MVGRVCTKLGRSARYSIYDRHGACFRNNPNRFPEIRKVEVCTE